MIRLFRVVLPASILALFISEALLLLASFGLAAYFDANLSEHPFALDQQGWQVDRNHGGAPAVRDVSHPDV